MPFSRRGHQHAAIVGVDGGVVDVGAGAALGVGRGRHAQRLVAVLVDAARRAVARAIDRVGHAGAAAQGAAETLALARDQPVARGDAQLGQEALAQRAARQADLARHLSQRRRGVGIAGIEQLAGARHRLAEADLGLPVARLAALARTEARRFRRLGRGVEVDVARATADAPRTTAGNRPRSS